MPASVELPLPHLDLTGVPVTVCTWHAQPGERVVEGDRLLEVVAGDVSVDIPAPVTGRLAARHAEIDERLMPGQLLATIEPTP